MHTELMFYSTWSDGRTDSITGAGEGGTFATSEGEFNADDRAVAPFGIKNGLLHCLLHIDSLEFQDFVLCLHLG